MKKQNRKQHVTFLILLLLVCGIATGCGNTQENNNVMIGSSNSDSDSAETEEQTAADVYSFVYNNVKITPNALTDPLITALGSDYTYNESASCAYTGLDKMYIYNGFIIYTYPDDNAADHVLRVVLTDDSLSTPEGLRLSDASSKVTELYGDDYLESDGSYAYTRGKTQLVIVTKDGIVQSIQYNYTDAL